MYTIRPRLVKDLRVRLTLKEYESLKYLFKERGVKTLSFYVRGVLRNHIGRCISSEGKVKVKKVLMSESIKDTTKREKFLAARKSIEEVLKKTGRNDTCPCGSGKKFKKCCSDSLNASFRGGTGGAMGVA